jgi:hypothetical protein
VIEELIDMGVELNECEVRALVDIKPGRAEAFAVTLHPCIQRVEIKGGNT